MAKKEKVEQTEQTVDTTATETGPEVTAEPVQLTLQDMNALASVIDLASKRGAFQAGELAAVGNVYNKLHSFLQYVASQQSQAQAEEAETEAPAEAK